MTNEESKGADSASVSTDGLCVLRLTLKRKWFDMIASGEKREEYREMKPYWHKRLMCSKRKFDCKFALVLAQICAIFVTIACHTSALKTRGESHADQD